MKTSSRPLTRSTLQRVGTESRSRGLGRGNAAVDGQLNRNAQRERPSSARSFQGRTGPAPTNKRPSSARPSSTQGNVMLGRGKMLSTSKGAAEKRPLSNRVAVASGSSRLSSSFSRNVDKTSSAQSSSASGRGKVLSSKLNEPSTRSSCQPAGKFQPVTSNKKNRSLLAQENSSGRPSSALSSSGAIRKAPTNSRPALLNGNDKRFTREKPLTVEGSRVEAKNVPAGSKAAAVSNSRHCRPKESKAPMPSCNPNKVSASTDCKEKNPRRELFKNGTEGLEASTEQNIDCVSSFEEKTQATENVSSRTRERVEILDSENESNSQGGAQANSPGTVNTQDAPLLLNEAVGEGCSKSQSHDSPDGSKMSDSLELD